MQGCIELCQPLNITLLKIHSGVGYHREGMYVPVVLPDNIPDLVGLVKGLINVILSFISNLFSITVSGSLADVIMFLLMVLFSGMVYELFMKIPYVRNRFIAFVFALVFFLSLYNAIFVEDLPQSSFFSSVIVGGSILVLGLVSVMLALFKVPYVRKKKPKRDKDENSQQS